MKKYLLIAAVVALSVFNLAGAFTQVTSANDGDINYGCLSAGCSGGATCGGKGWNAGSCVVGCDNGATLICPH